LDHVIVAWSNRALILSDKKKINILIFEFIFLIYKIPEAKIAVQCTVV
jgi:hypothetical protein